MNEDAHLGIDDWLIIVGGYGAFEFRGTESEAEEMRRNKSRWEGAVAKKRRLTKRAADGNYCTCKKKYPTFDVGKGYVCTQCRRFRR